MPSPLAEAGQAGDTSKAGRRLRCSFSRMLQYLANEVPGQADFPRLGETQSPIS